MEWIEISYFVACSLIWMGLMVLVWFAFRTNFAQWLTNHRKAFFYLLGVQKLPNQPEKTLKRFYGFLAGGWTWILLWSWWFMPELKDYFFQSVETALAYKIARWSTLIVVAGYAAVGFFAIGKAITIWFKEIYAPTTTVKR